MDMSPNQIMESLNIHRRILAEIKLTLAEIPTDEANLAGRVCLYREGRQLQGIIISLCRQLGEKAESSDYMPDEENLIMQGES